MRRVFLLALVFWLTAPPSGSSAAAEEGHFAEELAAVRQRVADLKRQLGEQAGVPEVPDEHQAIPKPGRWLTATEAEKGFARLRSEVSRHRWWVIGLNPTNLDHALREPASVVSGCVHLWRAEPGEREACLNLARDAADFLVWAQAQAGTGLIPFPAVRGKSHNNAFGAAGRYLARTEREGRLPQVVRNGWIIDDAGDGGLQFDNGESGVALFELYEITRDTNYLTAARSAADWAATRPLAVNWNYNSFSVYLLAKAFAVTGERRYLAAATHKARLGVIPGQLTEGLHAGRWLDPHNARPAYHYIMLRALVVLATVLEKDDPIRSEIVQSLQAGLRARNRDFLGPGAPSKDHAMEVLLLVNRDFAMEPQFLRETFCVEALDALVKLVSEQARRGGLPLGPRPWGMLLEHIAAAQVRAP